MTGLWSREVTHDYLASLPLVIAATALGRRLNRGLDPARFLRSVHVGLVAIGLILLIQAAMGAGTSGPAGHQARGLENRPGSAQPGKAVEAGTYPPGSRNAEDALR